MGNSTPVKQLNKKIVQHGNRLTQDHCDILNAEVTGEEIKAAMFDIPGTKAPRPDGYSSQFFKDNWSIVSADVINAIKNAYESGNLLKQVNNTIITLIPMTEIPETVMQFRPITCCNTIYKCLSKVICARLSRILPDIISPSKGAFIKGRDIVGNILIFQDLIKMYNRKSCSPRVLMKLDLQKAYDSVEWFLFLRCLRLLGERASIDLLLKAFNYFSKATGLVMNSGKSNFYANGVPDSLMRKIEQIRGLGSIKLSYAGRVVLIQSVLSTLHCYWARIFILPKTVIDAIEKMCRQYLWYGKDPKENPAMVSREKICRPKKQRGLGLRDLHTWNIATLGTYIWWVQQKTDHLWVDYEPSSGASWAWRKICQVENIFKSFLSAGEPYTAQKGYLYLKPLTDKVAWIDKVVIKPVCLVQKVQQDVRARYS
ncbi:uncharacterized protein LOC141631833 [Silene latifolia]|uniref:uncharacterized protein LOC141631833 n=1 Tax=Silene latifolia TaxID=37657 RepID=UPI003D773B0F